MRKSTFPVAQAKNDFVELKGGLDTVTPTLELPPGALRESVNFECALNGGYTRIGGYERFSGKAKPSEQTFTLVPITSFTNTPSVGQTLTGNTSATTGQIIVVTSTYVCVTLVTGVGYATGETVKVVATTIGTVGAHSTVTLSQTLRKQYVNLAADVYRALIAAVPGVGPVRGVFGATFNGAFAMYAIRDENVNNNRSSLYKSSSSGWVQVHGYPATNSYWEVNFRNGSGADIADNTYTTTKILLYRVVLTGGSWAAGTATGKIIYDTSTGAAFSPNQTITVGTTTMTTISSYTQGEGTGTYYFPVGGFFEFDFANFYGQSGTGRIYGCDGVGRAWEFDGTLVVPIDAGTPAIATSPIAVRPSHLKVHQNHLFLGVQSSVLNSGIGYPFKWTSTDGSGEYASGDTVTGFMVLPGSQQTGAMAVYGRNQTKILYGTAMGGSNPFSIIGFGSETGALPFSPQRLERVLVLDDRGVIDLRTAQEFGNFASETLTRNVQDFINLKKGRFIGSMINRSKNQYRLFFNDWTALYLTFDGTTLTGAMPMSFSHHLTSFWSGEDANGAELSFAGDENGYVYQFDRGTSFDGSSIRARLLTNWNTMKSPRVRKTVHGASVELQEGDYAELTFGARLGPEIESHLQDALGSKTSTVETVSVWDAFTWDAFWFDGHAVSPVELDVKGTSERLQYILQSDSDYLDSFTVTGINTRYFQRRGVRG